MKRSVLLISAFAVFGLLFTQCKKNQEVLPVIPSGEKIDVTLNVPNNGGSKTSIADDGTIVWTGNDKIVVCYSGGSGDLKYKGVVGILSITNNVNTNVATFTGQITLMGEMNATGFDSYLYDFHYLGSDFDVSTITNDDDSYKTSYMLDFTNQDGTLAGLSKLHYAMGTGNFKNVNGNYTANLVLENKICVFSYDVTAMVDQTNTYAVDNFYMTFPNTAPNTKLTVGFTGGYNDDDNTKTIYLGKPTKQGERYKFYVILPGYNEGSGPSVDVQFFSDSHSQDVAINHPAEHFAHNSYNGGLNEEGGYNFDGSIGNCTNMLDKGCARGIFKTASGRLIRFAKGNLKYDTSGVSLHTTQVEAYLENNSINGFDHFAFGATGIEPAPRPSLLYTTNNISWYYTGYNLTGVYDYGRMLDNNDNYTTFSTMRSDDLTNFYSTNTIYSNSTGKVPPQNTGRQVIMLTKESIDPQTISKQLTPTLVKQYEQQYNAIFLLYSGYNSAPSENIPTLWNGEANYYWLADGINNKIKMLDLSTLFVEDVAPYHVEGEGYPVRLVHTEFDPN